MIKQGVKMKTYLCLIIMSIAVSTQAADKAFASTEPGSIEFKKIPAHTLIYSETDRSYFSENNGLFGKLFNYIQSNQIPMTSPVKADINPGKMYFYIGSPETHAPLLDTKGVKVIEEEAYWVISMAQRGAYSRENFNETEQALYTALGKSDDWKATGPAYAIYWNGPYVPSFMKQYEVHIPVAPKK